MASEGSNFTHYVISNEVVLGEACVIEKCNEWILACVHQTRDRQAGWGLRPRLRRKPRSRSQNLKLTPELQPTSSKTHHASPSTSARRRRVLTPPAVQPQPKVKKLKLLN